MKKLPYVLRLNPFVALLAIFLLAFPLAFYGIYLFLAPTLPDMQRLKLAVPESQMTIYSKDGVSLGNFGDKLSFPITYDQIPKRQIQAFLAAEDSGFFEHSGISVKSLARAIYEAISNAGAQTGGSTITMQVAKNYFLSPERTLTRKLTEVFLAREMEQALTKTEILELYVNKIFLGHHAYGISAAALTYYSKPLNELNIAQMAMLAGLPKAPSKYNPVNNPIRALQRRNWILGRMQQLGYITIPEYKEAINSPDTLNMYQAEIQQPEPYISEMVRAELVSVFGPEIVHSGYRVYTTINSERQQYASESVRLGLEAYDRRHGWRGAEANNKPLSEFKQIKNMLPARVVKITGSSIDAMLADDTVINIPWSHMSWARRYYSADRIGGAGSPRDVVKLHDIIRVTQDPETTSWWLNQIPKVQGQLIALDPRTGSLEAVVGGYDFGVSTFNRSIQGWRQAGSTIKPFIYAFALERGFSPYSIVQDSPLSSGKWRPQNSDHRFLGAIPLRKALYLSRNLVSIRLLQAVGINRARSRLHDFGLDSARMPSNLTLSLGTGNVLPIQMATGYAAFANGGYRIQPYFIDHIEDPQGKILFQAKPYATCAKCLNAIALEKPVVETNPEPEITAEVTATADISLLDEPEPRPNYPLIKPEITKQPVQTTTSSQILPPMIYRQAERILPPHVAFDMANILRDVIQVGTGVAAKKLGRSDIGGKTGTTSDSKDAWFAGFQPTLVAIAWVGFDNPSTLGRREYGGIAALPLWTKFMGNALKDTPQEWVRLTKNNPEPEVDTSQLNEQEAAKVYQKQVDERKTSLSPPLATLIPKPIPEPEVITPVTPLKPKEKPLLPST